MDKTIFAKKIHAYLAQAAWCFLASFMVIVNRHIYGYMWRWFFWIHAICGTLVLMLNTATSIYAIRGFNWVLLYKYAHFWFVAPLLFCVLAVVIHGVIVKNK